MHYDVAIIGLGYVGLPLAREAVHEGMRVGGLDLNAGLVESLRAGRSHVDDIPDADIDDMLARGFVPTTDETMLKDASVIIICVPTPLSEDGTPDLRAVVGATEAIERNISAGTLVILESTTYPGTTEEILLPMIEASGKRSVGKDFHLAFSPERVDPGNKTFGTKNTPKVVGGVTEACTARAVEFYSRIVDTVVPASGTREAETAKLLENTYRHVNIALVNEMLRFCHELDIDLWEVIRLASTKPFGFQAFYPGPGVGGHCIPIDPNYLSYSVQTRLGYPFKFVELAQEINASMPGYVARRAQDILNGDRLAVNGASILLLGVTYKPNIADQRESPSVDVAQALIALGAEVSYHDPFVKSWTSGGLRLDSVDDLDTTVSDADIVVLLQHHDEYDADALAQRAKRFLDTRGVTRGGTAHRL